MRSHLKRNYEKLHNDGDADAVSPSVDLPDDGVALPVSGESRVDHEKLSRMPSLRKNTDSQIDRERRELEGKVIHDLAELENRLVLLKHQQNEAEEFYRFLERAHKELLTLSEKEDRSALARLQLEYFATGGRWRAFERNGVSPEVTARGDQTGRRSGEWFVGAAVVAGSIIVAVTMVLLFG